MIPCCKPPIYLSFVSHIVRLQDSTCVTWRKEQNYRNRTQISGCLGLGVQRGLEAEEKKEKEIFWDGATVLCDCDRGDVTTHLEMYTQKSVWNHMEMHTIFSK